MSTSELEQRVALLERQIAALLPRPNGSAQSQPGSHDWKQTVGMFDGDPIFREMLEEARRLREADRQRARDAALQEPT